MPNYETPLAAGMDVRADIAGGYRAGSPVPGACPDGTFVELPAGYEMQVRPRSVLAAKYGVTVLNAPGTIDADYRGKSRSFL